MQDSSYGVPIGTVIAWPLGSAPLGLHEDHWLECNGQAVDKSKYPRLAELMSNVPDYQGMFLRGLGGNSAKTLGAQQNDAIRNITGTIGENQWVTGRQGDRYITSKGGSTNTFYIAQGNVGSGSWPTLYDDGLIENYQVTNNFRSDWYNALTHYKTTPDRLHVTTSNVEGVGNVVTGVSLDPPEEIHPSLIFSGTDACLFFDVSQQVPTAEENRPVNKAVRYMIKAK